MDEQLRIMLGQKLSIGIYETEMTDALRQLLHETKAGNVILFRRNVVSFQQLSRLCQDLREVIQAETGYLPFIMLDEECGNVSRLSHLAGNTPCAMVLGRSGDPENAYRVAKGIGRQLLACGVNFNLAPVVDCFLHPENTADGNRCFSSDPNVIADMAVQYMCGLHESGIFTCCKHFVGAGDTEVDSHLALPLVTKSYEALEAEDLIPFRRVIEAGTDSIMSAHIVMPSLGAADGPITLSRSVMTGFLREKLGFSGIVVSDALEMNAVSDMFPLPDAIRYAFAAGIDIGLVCHSPDKVDAALCKMEQYVKAGTLDAAEIRESFERIIASKERIPVPTGDVHQFDSPEFRQLSSELMDRSVCITHCPADRELHRPNASTVFTGVKSARASQAVDNPVDYYGAKILAEHYGAAWWEKIPETFPQPPLDVVIFVEYYGRADSEAFCELARQLDKKGCRVTVVSMYTEALLDTLSDSIVKICAWQYDALSVDALIHFMDRLPE